MTRIQWILPILLCIAWSYPSHQAGHTFRTYTEDGVTVAETTGGPKYTEALFSYEKEMVIDIGQSEETLLYRPTQFVADAAGNFYIYDSGIGSILMFDASGRYLRSIGQEGQGPGEFRGGHIQMIHDDVVQFFDHSLRRTTRFQTAGTLLDVVTLPVGTGILGASGFVILENGMQLILASESDMPSMGITQRRGAVTLSAQGDTLGVAYTPWIKMLETISYTIMGRSMTGPTPLAYGPWPTATYHPLHGIILSPSILPELHLFDNTCHPVGLIRLAMEAEPVTQSDRAAARQEVLSRVDTVDESLRETVQTQAENMPFADHKAFWSLVEIDSDGYFWLDTGLFPALALILEGSHTCRILSPEGEYLETTVRPYTSGSSISNGRLLTLEENPDTGEINPTIYRIQSEIEGFIYP